LLPLIASDAKTAFVKSGYPWAQFAELIRLRNVFVHPKHDRAAYYKAVASHEFKPLDWKKIPASLGIKEGDVIYRQTQIPKDPYSIRLVHVDTTKRVVDDMVKELDKMLGGRLTGENWYRTDYMELVYPAGATFADMAAKVPASKPVK
jgi:hypothetical protein